MRTVKKWKYLRANEFKQIKAMLDAGVSTTMVNRMTGRGIGTLTYIKNAKDFDDYVKARRARSQRQLEDRQAPTADDKPVDTPADYTKIKALAELGLNQHMIKKTTGYSVSTISRVLRSDNFEDYDSLNNLLLKEEEASSPVLGITDDLTKYINQFRAAYEQLDEVLKSLGY